MKSIDFNINTTLENVFFTSWDKTALKSQWERCDKLPKRLVVRDLQQSWSNLIDRELQEVEEDEEDEENRTEESADSRSSNEGNQSDGDEENFSGEPSSSSSSSPVKLDAKLCLGKTHSGNELVYISKFDMLEIEYKVKLNERESIKANSFAIIYEFVDRQCDRLIKTSSKSTHKGFSLTLT